MHKPLLPLMIFTTLCACGPATQQSVPRVTVVDPEVRIAESLERLESKVGQLSRIQKARRKTRIDNIPFAPTELKRTISYYEYTGHLSRIVQDVSEQSGYQFKLIGRQPNIPIIISIKWENITLIDALKDLGTRAAHRATVFVDADEAVIEVRYD